MNSHATITLAAHIDTDVTDCWHPDNTVSLKIQSVGVEVDVWIQGSVAEIRQFVIDLDAELSAAMARRRESLAGQLAEAGA